MKDYNVANNVVVRVGSHINGLYELQVSDVLMLLKQEIAEKLVAESLPEDQLVWHINEKADSSFFNALYPEWSLVPHPEDWVAGNIYYRNKKAAVEGLKKAIQAKIAYIETHANKQIEFLKQQLEKLN